MFYRCRILGGETVKIGLASYRCENKNIEFNIRRIERAMRKVQGKADPFASGTERLRHSFPSIPRACLLSRWSRLWKKE